MAASIWSEYLPGTNVSIAIAISAGLLLTNVEQSPAAISKPSVAAIRHGVGGAGKGEDDSASGELHGRCNQTKKGGYECDGKLQVGERSSVG
jgi:hypothetical protein